MDIKKALQIAFKDVYMTFTDRGALLLIFLAPFLLSLIIGAAFSQFLGGANDVPISNVKIAVVNEDKGAAILLQTVNYGDIVTGILVPPSGKPIDPTNPLWKLLSATQMTREEAIAKVDKGELKGAILIPADFTQSINPVNDKPVQTTITVYNDSGDPLTATILTSVVRGIVNQVSAGNIAIFAAGDVNPILKTQGQAISEEVVKILTDTTPITIQERTLTGVAPTTSFDPLQYFAPAMAVFFLTFTAASGAGTLIEERDTWTLQRMLSSPTSKLTILAGKLSGVYIIGVIQVGLLIVAMAFIAPILGSAHSVWGTNIFGLIVLTLCTVAAATGIATLITAVAKTAQQAGTFGGAILTLSGIFGGAFFDLSNVPIVKDFSKITLNYWATNGFSTLARTNDFTNVLPNCAVLLGMFAVFFGIGAFLIDRRLTN